MEGLLITWGCGHPRYSREVEFYIDPCRFVEIEARSMAKTLDGEGSVTAKLVVGRKTFLCQIDAGTVQPSFSEEMVLS